MTTFNRRSFLRIAAAAAVGGLNLAVSKAAHADEVVYQNAIDGVVYIEASKGSGSGALIDAASRYVITANHVVADGDEAVVVFAQRDATGNVINEVRYYSQNMLAIGIRGRVVARNLKADIAILQLDRLPEGVKELKIGRARPGQDVHMIGNSSLRFGGLFGVRRGMVTNMYRSTPGRLFHDCQILETQVPSNHGDSGGPVVNDRGELVGIVSTGTDGIERPKTPYANVQVTDHCIDAIEVTLLLEKVRLEPASPFIL